MHKLAKSILHLPVAGRLAKNKTVASGEMSKDITSWTQSTRDSSTSQISSHPPVSSSPLPPESTPEPNTIKTNSVTGHMYDDHKHPNQQAELPRLPIPPLEETLRRYVRALEGLQDTREHEATKRAVDDFLNGEGPRIQDKLIAYAKDKARYVTLRPIRFPITTTSSPILVILRSSGTLPISPPSPFNACPEDFPCIGMKAT